MNTFSWVPEFGASKAYRPITNTVTYGDGYQQRYAKGINALAADWTLSFANRDPSEANAIDAFLVTAAGIAAFQWQPPDASAPLAYVCVSWQKIPVKGGRYTITATFQQVFEP